MCPSFLHFLPPSFPTHLLSSSPAPSPAHKPSSQHVSAPSAAFLRLPSAVAWLRQVVTDCCTSRCLSKLMLNADCSICGAGRQQPFMCCRPHRGRDRVVAELKEKGSTLERENRIKARRNRRRSLTGKRGEENRGRSLISNRGKKQIGEPLRRGKVEKEAAGTCSSVGGGGGGGGAWYWC